MQAVAKTAKADKWTRLKGTFDEHATIDARLFCVIYTDRKGIKRIISLRKANNREKENMHLTTKSGKKILLHSDEEDAIINAGIAADPDTYERSSEEFKQLRPVGRD